jgi:hypothetical protein
LKIGMRLGQNLDAGWAALAGIEFLFTMVFAQQRLGEFYGKCALAYSRRSGKEKTASQAPALKCAAKLFHDLVMSNNAVPHRRG